MRFTLPVNSAPTTTSSSLTVTFFRGKRLRGFFASSLSVASVGSETAATTPERRATTVRFWDLRVLNNHPSVIRRFSGIIHRDWRTSKERAREKGRVMKVVSLSGQVVDDPTSFLTVRDSSKKVMGQVGSSTRGTHLAATRGRVTACGRAVICVDARERWVSLNSLHSFFTTFALVVLDRVVLAGDVSSHPPRSPPPSRVTSSSVPRFREVPGTRRRRRPPTRRRRSESLKNASFGVTRVHPQRASRRVASIR